MKAAETGYIVNCWKLNGNGSEGVKKFKKKKEFGFFFVFVLFFLFYLDFVSCSIKPVHPNAAPMKTRTDCKP